MRNDTKRNRRRLIEAAAFLVCEHGPEINMAHVAERAEVAAATAYRHFTSVDEILAEYRFEVGLRLLEFSQRQADRGTALLHSVSSEWIRLVVRHGSSMVHTRSDRGYLMRLRSGTRYLKVQAEALERPLREALEELGIPAVGDEALFLWNVLFDPREIFDLLNAIGLSPTEAADRLVSTYLEALKGWVLGRRGSDQSSGAPKASWPSRDQRYGGASSSSARYRPAL